MGGTVRPFSRSRRVLARRSIADDDAVEFIRFAEVGVREILLAAQAMPLILGGGENQDRQIRGASEGPDPLEQFEPVHDRHHQIEHDAVGQVFLQCAEPLRSVRGRPHGEAARLQLQRENSSHRGVIFHEQDMGRVIL